MHNHQYPLNCYVVLDVEFFSTQDEIKKGYRTASKKAHPDLGGSNQRQQEVNQAYDILKNPVARSQHDQIWLKSKSKKSSNKNAYKRHEYKYKQSKRSSQYSHRNTHEETWNKSYDSNFEYMGAIKRRFNSEHIKISKKNYADFEKTIVQFNEDLIKTYKDGKENIRLSLLYASGFTLVGFLFPLLFIGTAINLWSAFSNMIGINVYNLKISIFDSKAYLKIRDQAHIKAEDNRKNKLLGLDKYSNKLLDIENIITDSAQSNDSEEFIAKKVIIALFLMGYQPKHYFQNDRIFIVSDGDEKLAIRFRHRHGQATNISYLKKLYDTMQIHRCNTGLLFCPMGISDNALSYAKNHGIKTYQLKEMNSWINKVIQSSYTGPKGDLFKSILDLTSFLKTINPPVPYRHSRRRY